MQAKVLNQVFYVMSLPAAIQLIFLLCNKCCYIFFLQKRRC